MGNAKPCGRAGRRLIDSPAGLLTPGGKCAIRPAVCHFGAPSRSNLQPLFGPGGNCFLSGRDIGGQIVMGLPAVNGLVSRLLWVCCLLFLGLGPHEMRVQQAKVVFWFREQCHGHNTSYNDESHDI